MGVLQKLAELGHDIRMTPERAMAAHVMAWSSGLVWEWSLPGVTAAISVLLSGSHNPGSIYRIHAKNTPDKVALIYRDTKVTFRELDAMVDRVAHALSRRGVKRGTSFLLVMKNKIELVALAIAAARIGASCASVSFRSTSAELTYLAANSGARAIVFDHDLAKVIEGADIAPQVARITVGGHVAGLTELEDLTENAPNEPFLSEKGADDDAAVVIYTSGTTGKPKGAVRKFPVDAITQACRFIGETPMRADDVHLVTCPLYHSTAFGFLSFSQMLGCTSVLMEDFKPEQCLELIAKHRVTTTAIVPTMLHRILDLGPDVLKKYETRSLRAIFSGGAPLPPLLGLRVMDEFGDVLYNFYGATETGLVTLAKPEDLRAAPGTIGRALPGNELRLLDDDGHDVKSEGDAGELYVRNHMLVEGYHKDDAATKDSMKDGFFSVGDLARKDRDGRYFIEGRKRDMIISGGVNVYPAEVEAAIEAHPAVSEVAVVGVPDEEWGERVRAFVALRAGADVDDAALKAFAKTKLSGAKVPRDFVFLEALPRNPTGKVLKRELRDRTT